MCPGGIIALPPIPLDQKSCGTSRASKSSFINAQSSLATRQGSREVAMSAEKKAFDQLELLGVPTDTFFLQIVPNRGLTPLSSRL